MLAALGQPVPATNTARDFLGGWPGQLVPNLLTQIVANFTTTRSRAMRRPRQNVSHSLGWHDPVGPQNQITAKGRGLYGFESHI